MNAQPNGVERRQHKVIRVYRFLPAKERRLRLIRLGALAVMVIAFAVSAVHLLSYRQEHQQSRALSLQLREAYYTIGAPDTEDPPTDAATALPAAAPVSSMLRDDTSRLLPVYYPGNPYRSVSSRFEKIRRQNPDIIGWVSIEDLVDEAVVQRDNEYYLRRDYRGYHNENGAIFLDEACDLTYRPYTLMLYGHNMKSGAMFGGLRSYESLSFYKSHPFVTFDSIYESSRYVIFSVLQAKLTYGHWQFVDFVKLTSDNITLRQDALNQLQSKSIFISPIDVRPEDQLLLLITCTGDSSERRVVAARRLRDGETEQSLRNTVDKTRSR